MSIIRNLLYSGSSFDALYSGILYNQNLLHNFIRQHQPKFILHCGSPENALDLAYFVKENQPCEILHIKNWNPSTNHWLQAVGEPPNPHKIFLDKISEYKLEDYLVSFDGFSEVATEVLNYRNFRFNMMISDNIGDNTDYVPLLKLLQKNALHIRYIGDKNLSQIREEPIFQTDIETSLTYAQGYLITGMDYLSLYEEQSVHTTESTHHNHDNIRVKNKQTADIQKNMPSELVWNGIDFCESSNDYTHDSDDNHNDDKDNDNDDTASDIKKHTSETDNEQQLSNQEKREQRRLERREARAERQKLRSNNDINPNNTAPDTKIEQPKVINNHQAVSELLPFEIEDDGGNAISAARRALRARRAERRQKRAENT